MLEWLNEEGRLAAIEERNIREAEKLYAAIDASPFYTNPIDPAVRSRMMFHSTWLIRLSRSPSMTIRDSVLAGAGLGAV